MSCCLFGSHTSFHLLSIAGKKKGSLWGYFFYLAFISPPQHCGGSYPYGVCKPRESSFLCAWDWWAHPLSQACDDPWESAPLHGQMCGACGMGGESKFLLQLVGTWWMVRRQMEEDMCSLRASTPVEGQGSDVVLSKMPLFCPCKLHACLVVWKVVCPKLWEVWSSQKDICTEEPNLVTFEISPVWDLWQVER